MTKIRFKSKRVANSVRLVSRFSTLQNHINQKKFGFYILKIENSKLAAKNANQTKPKFSILTLLIVTELIALEYVF